MAAQGSRGGRHPSRLSHQSLAYAPEAITMVTADLYMPTKGVIDSARAQYDGISMRSISAYLPGSSTATMRRVGDCIVDGPR
ncbi:hypothetical protein XH98_15260 [Bradyrhizobium sp. CCBAU 51745]|uniref:hypothetical protein n=1 Tax=Bradyrhizobium sp. CCBAU 51745 TaxID=1325099 RepID=UPI0023053F05|nr:hypothetical protein [Bradyrhizobium sp. CCBAU 51745]MDA9440449.1 hypothetical protein [Bradyrhizobium sp. CCBAU 51745]